ncbi:hypothetical protein D3C81_850910 [compost metagenome]
MADELEARFVDVDQGTEGFVRGLVLGAGIHQRTLGAGEGQGVAVGFEQVLTDFRADALDQVADVAQDRVVAANCMAFLQQVDYTDQAEQRRGQGEGPQPLVLNERQADQGEGYAGSEEGVAAEK